MRIQKIIKDSESSKFGMVGLEALLCTGNAQVGVQSCRPPPSRAHFFIMSKEGS
jgi:hypothetical protein